MGTCFSVHPCDSSPDSVPGHVATGPGLSHSDIPGIWLLPLQVVPQSCALPASIREISFSRWWLLPRYPMGSYHVPVQDFSPAHLGLLCHSAPRARDQTVIHFFRALGVQSLADTHFGLKLGPAWKSVDYSYQVLWVSSLTSFELSHLKYLIRAVKGVISLRSLCCALCILATFFGVWLCIFRTAENVQ